MSRSTIETGIFMILDLFRNYICLIKWIFFASLLPNFSTIYAHMLSKFGKKSIQKSLIFSSKTNCARGLFMRAIFMILLTIVTCEAKKTQSFQEHSRVSKKYFLTESPTNYEEYCFKEINKVREKHGLPPFSWSAELANCARVHSQNMANRICSFGHDGFKKRAKEIAEVLPYSKFGENVAYNYNYEDPVIIAVDGWMNSEGHKKNILGEFEQTGIGIAYSEKGAFYVTQLFSQPRIKTYKTYREIGDSVVIEK